MAKQRDNTGGGSSKDAPPPSSDTESSGRGVWLIAAEAWPEEDIAELGPRRDLQYARQCVTVLLTEYVHLGMYCRDNHTHRLTLPENKRDTPTEILPLVRRLNPMLLRLMDVLQETLPNVAKAMAMLDAVSRGPVTIGDISTSNAHSAIVRLGLFTQEILDESGLKLLPEEQKEDQNAVDAWTRTIRHGVPSFLVLMAEAPVVNPDELAGSVRIEYEAALASLPRLSSFEKLIVSILRQHGHPMPGDELLIAAKLNPSSGTNKALLADAHDRGTVTNNRTKGYGLPEWNIGG